MVVTMPGVGGQQQVRHRRAAASRDVLRQQLRDAEERERAQRELTAMAVHDIRTPTTVIAGLAEVLQRNMAQMDPAQVADLLATIHRNTERVEHLLDDLLTMAQLQTGRFSYDLRPVDLSAVVAKVTTEIGQATARTIDLASDPALPPALADGHRQVQILHNLLSNAAKFSPNGTPISVRIARCGDHLLVEVRDHGRGIPRHDLDRLFAPFARLDTTDADRVDDNGLGLHITKMLVEGQGGTIGIASTPGEGTTVTYTVPVADSRSDPDKPPQPPTPRATGE